MGEEPLARFTPVLAVALSLVVAPAASARPNLATTNLSNPPRTAVVAGAFDVRDTVKNKGTRRARGTDTRFYLSVDPKPGLGDVLMTGARTVPALRPGRRSAAPRRPRLKATVPVGTPAGEYFMLACADDRFAVRESNERDNCRAARGKVRVKEPLTAPPTVVDAFSDATAPGDPASDEAQLETQRSFMCTPTPRSRVPSLQRAIANVKQSLSQRAGKDAYASFERSRDYKSAAAAQRAATGAFLLEQPGAALAALVRAHELEPREASHLVNASAMATALGLPNEALAMLDAAARLDDRDRPAMGISRQAVALANRAHALAATGRNGEAVAAADAALAIEPLLAEAQQTAGMAELCANRMKPAVARIRKGRNRQPGKEPPLDDSAGKESSLRNLPLAAFPPQTVDLDSFYEQQSSRRMAEIQDRIRRENELHERINARGRYPSRTLNERLLNAVHTAGATPRIEQLRDEVSELFHKSHSWWQEKWCDGTSCEDEDYGEILTSCHGKDDFNGCVRAKCVPAARGWHQGWLNDNSALYQKSQEYFRALSRRMSALAAHINDPETYELAMLAIESQEDAIYFGAHQPAAIWANWFERAKNHCIEGHEPPPALEAERSAPQGPGPCPPSVRGVNFVLDLKVATFKVNCSEIQASGTLGEGWIKGFAEVTYDFRSGKATVFAGSQGEVAVGPVKGDFKSGVYVTGSATGIEDVGWRVGPSTNVGAGPVEFSGPSDTVDMSFVGAFSGLGG